MRIYIILILLFPLFCSGQDLLVNNSFEEENICTEYKVNCAPEGWIYTVPSFIYYFRDAKEAHSGTHFIGLIAGHAHKPYYRTFVRSQLLCGLRKGNTYRLEFFVRSPHSILDSIGVLFTPYDFLFEKRTYRRITPSLYLADATEKPVRGDTNWQKIVINYKATGTESFITLGNFSTLDITGPTHIDRENNYFVSVDDIHLVPLDNRESLCSDWLSRKEEIYNQDERHEYLDREMKEYRSRPVQQVQLTMTQSPRIDTLIIPDLLFATGKADLKSTGLLDTLYQKIVGYAIDSIVVEGHTDNTGTSQLNQKLSENRAQSVVDYMKGKLPAVMYITRGWGDQMPVADNWDPEGRKKNRRVEVYLYVRA